MINGGWRLLSHPIRSRPAFEWLPMLAMSASTGSFSIEINAAAL
jgi:hypothetical protein